MTITIDRLGRIVVPKAVRERFHLVPGSELELETDADGFHLAPSDRQASLVRKDGILIHHGTDTVDLDVVDYIARDREERNQILVAEDPPT